MKIDNPLNRHLPSGGERGKACKVGGSTPRHPLTPIGEGERGLPHAGGFGGLISKSVTLSKSLDSASLSAVVIDI